MKALELIVKDEPLVSKEDIKSEYLIPEKGYKGLVLLEERKFQGPTSIRYWM